MSGTKFNPKKHYLVNMHSVSFSYRDNHSAIGLLLDRLGLSLAKNKDEAWGYFLVNKDDLPRAYDILDGDRVYKSKTEEAK